MRAILYFGALLSLGCTEQNYPSVSYESPPSSPIDPPSPSAALHIDRYEWAAGACDPVQVPPAAILQLLDCQDATSGVTQCWPDAEQRLTLIDGTAYVLCPEDELSPDSYQLTVLSIG